MTQPSFVCHHHVQMKVNLSVSAHKTLYV